MNKLLSVDVAIPVIGKSMNLLVPHSVLGRVLLDTVEDLVEETYHLKSTGNLYFAKEGAMIDYGKSVGFFPRGQGLNLILM